MPCRLDTLFWKIEQALVSGCVMETCGLQKNIHHVTTRSLLRRDRTFIGYYSRPAIHIYDNVWAHTTRTSRFAAAHLPFSSSMVESLFISEVIPSTNRKRLRTSEIRHRTPERHLNGQRLTHAVSCWLLVTASNFYRDGSGEPRRRQRCHWRRFHLTGFTTRHARRLWGELDVTFRVLYIYTWHLSPRTIIPSPPVKKKTSQGEDVCGYIECTKREIDKISHQHWLFILFIYKHISPSSSDESESSFNPNLRVHIDPMDTVLPS